MFNTVTILKGSTRAVIHVNPNNPWAPEIREVTHHKLTDYDFIQTKYGRRLVPTHKFINVDVSRDLLYIPINALPLVLEQLMPTGIRVDVKDEPLVQPRQINVRMIDTFVPRPEQVGVIEFLTSGNMLRKGLATATGSGKTVSSIASLVKLGYAGVIIVSGLQDQWIRAIQQFTTATPEQIYLIQGMDSLVRLWEGEVKPSIFVCSLETIRLWVNRRNNYMDLPTWEQFLTVFGIGTKIMDEVHLNFHADTIIDLNSNVINNIYLTATFSAASNITRRIFKMIYPSSMRYGENMRKRYIDVYTYAFMGDVNEKRCVKSRGYNHARYEVQLLKRPTFLKAYFNDVLFPVVNMHFINKRRPGQKLLVYFALLETVDYAYKWFKETYPELKITKYIGGIADSVLKDNEVIISTPKKAGCGTDIKDLRVVIQTVSCKADTVVDQTRGRLRELPNGDTPEYVEIVDWGIQAQVRHYYERKDLHQERARNVFFYHLPGGGSEHLDNGYFG